MFTYAEIPDQIRDFLSMPDAVWTPEATMLATAHGDLCRQINQRLRRCMEYFRQGRRSEAVHLAACQPPLSEVVTLLDFPEAATWARACAANGQPTPPRVRADMLADLQSAAQIERELEPLLATLRMNALALAPPAKQLAVVRALAVRDGENEVWREMRAELETARYRELKSLAKTAFRSSDIATLGEIETELTANAWQEPIPEDLQLGLERALHRTRRQCATQQLAELAAEIVDAFGRQDPTATAALLQTWSERVTSQSLEIPLELQRQIYPAETWLATEDRRLEVQERLRTARAAIEEEQDEEGKRRRLSPRNWFGRRERTE